MTPEEQEQVTRYARQLQRGIITRTEAEQSLRRLGFTQAEIEEALS